MIRVTCFIDEIVMIGTRKKTVNQR